MINIKNLLTLFILSISSIALAGEPQVNHKESKYFIGIGAGDGGGAHGGSFNAYRISYQSFLSKNHK